MKNLIFCFTVIMTLCIPLHSGEIKPQEGYVSVSEGELYYRTYGSGEPIIVLHGGPGLNHSYFLPGMAELAKNYQVTFYDQRGSGKSHNFEIISRTITLHHFIEDLEALRKNLGYQKFILVGHSWGGLLAMSYALKYPKNLKSLILIGSIAPHKIGHDITRSEYKRKTALLGDKIQKLEKNPRFYQGDPALVSGYFKLLFTVYCHKPEDAQKLSFDLTPKSALQGFQVHSLFNKEFFSKNFDLREGLKKLDVPTLVIHGKSDLIPVSIAEEIAQSIPDAKLVLMDECGHFPYLEKPEEFFKIIRGFLKPQG